MAGLALVASSRPTFFFIFIFFLTLEVLFQSTDISWGEAIKMGCVLNRSLAAVTHWAPGSIRASSSLFLG